ncbi:hypothetical protein H6F43_12210 [Leptolyngbya sp. FACHB-36]|uniref:hypothetical protein n=1 Tax=Leptolyngbya sp. FACHB-36 TaxID=2692808 RepID=UPI001681513B|nr:hypothetical protein [Leptolyngbya sp. FACHB-36]MBD2020942.1 hypothetical protein [Leptolyngbya sp. FACHB-36]
MSNSYSVSYLLKITHDTVLKLSTKQAQDVSADQTCPIKQGAEYPIVSWATEAHGHVRVAFGLGKDGKQITFPGPDGRSLNTWILFKEHCEIFKNGKLLNPPRPPEPPASDSYALLLRPTGERDDDGCLTFTLAWTKNGKSVDRMTVLSGAPGTDIIYPTQDYAGSLRPLPEGVYDLGPVERGWFAPAIGNILVTLTVQPAYRVNNRDHFLIHEDANRSIAPGTAGCISPYSATDMERVVSWLNAQSRPRYLVADYGLGFLRKRGYVA